MSFNKVINNIILLLSLLATDLYSTGYLLPKSPEDEQPLQDFASTPKDEKILREIRKELHNDWDLKNKTFVVRVINGYVTIHGHLSDPVEAKTAIDIIENIDGVIGIKDELYSGG